MARGLRIDYPGAVYHLICCGQGFTDEGIGKRSIEK